MLSFLWDVTHANIGPISVLPQTLHIAAFLSFSLYTEFCPLWEAGWMLLAALSLSPSPDSTYPPVEELLAAGAQTSVFFCRAVTD